ncbi:MAG TPA: hypothetical protein VHO70_20180 [Chitinispirillaceae bacterium]|nr:hypothetical protein [Chitinispirillaceae bacterium]
MRNQVLRIHLGIAVLLLVNIICTLPQNVDPVEWKMHVEFPVIQQKILIRDILNQDGMKGFPYAAAGAGDTMTCMREEQIEYTFEQPLGSTDSFEVRQTLGVSTIQGMPPVKLSLPVISGMPLSYKAGSKLKEATQVSISRKTCRVEGVAMVRFDENSPGLTITLTNNATQCEMDDIVMALMDSADAIAVLHMAHLDAGASKTVTVPVAGKCLKSPVAFALSVSLPEGAVVNVTDLLTLYFSFNGLTISEAYIEDRFIKQFSTLYAELPLSDSLKIEHIETDETILEFLVESSAQLKLRVRGSLSSVVPPGGKGSTHAVFTGVDKESAHLTSNELFTVDTLVASVDAQRCRMNVPLRALVLNPGWDNQKNRSTIGCTFTIGIIGENKMIHFRKQDEIRMVLYPICFPLKKCTGQCIKPLVQTESTGVNSGLLVEDKNIQKVQKSLVFNSARLKFDLDPGLPDGCRLDSMLIKTVMRSEKSSNDSVELVMTLTDLTSGSHHCAEMEFGKLLNHWPDKFTFDVRLLLPPGTGFVVENNPDSSGNSGKALRFSPKLVWKSLVPLCWKVNEKTVIELEKTVVNFTDKQLDMLTTLEEPEMKIILKICNKSNITCTVAAIGAPLTHENELFAYPDSLIGRALLDLPEHLFTFTGTNGVTLSPRNEISITEMTFDKSCINAIVRGQECVIRWFLMVFPGETDALMKDDYIQVDATGVVEGKSSTEVLIAMK